MENVLFPAVGLIAWTICGYKLVHLVRQPNLQRALLCGMIGFPATSYLVAWPALYHRVDAATGVPNIATLIVYTGVVLFAVCAQLWLAVVVYPGEQRRRRTVPRLVGFGVALVAMAVLFAAAPVDREADQFEAAYATAPWVPAFLVVYLAAFAVGLAGVAQLCWRWAGQTARVPLRRGLRLIAGGSVVAMGYVVAKAAYVLLRQVGIRAESLNTLAPLFASAGSLLLLAGFLTPACSRLADWTGRWRAYQRIYPMWRQLVAAVPEVELPGAGGPRWPVLAVRHLDFLLYRRIVECRDARLLLRDWLDPEVAARSRRACADAGITGLAAEAAVEAAQLRAALRARAARSAPAAVVDASGEQWPGTGGADLTSEAEWFLRVAVCFQRSGLGGATP